MFKEVYKRVLKQRFHIRNLCNPFINWRINLLGDFPGTNLTCREIPLIVCLTITTDKFDNIEQTLYSLLNQSLKPDRLILYLTDEFISFENLPYEITQFIKNGLEIKYGKGFKSYTKTINAFKDFPDAIIVEVSDEVYYPSNWLKRLYLSYISHPEDIHIHKANKVVIDGDTLTSCITWQENILEEKASYYNFPLSIGGILYPPNCFNKEFLREDIFLKYSKDSYDVWVWVMGLINKRKFRVVKNHINSLIYTKFFKHIFSKNKKENVDIALNNLMKFYGQNVLSKLN